MAKLMTHAGSYLTMIADRAKRVLPALQKELDCGTIRVVKAPIDGEHDWVCFEVPKPLHVAARAYLRGWERGCGDGLDMHYGRKSIEESAEDYLKAHPEDRV